MADKKILASAIEVVTKISDGSKIKSVQYQAGASGTTAPTGTWSNNVVATSVDKPYLWTKTIYEYEGKDSEPVYTVGGTIEGVQVGGRNLIENSSGNMGSISGWSIGIFSENGHGAENCIINRRSSGSTTTRQLSYHNLTSKIYDLAVGTSLTLSGWYYVESEIELSSNNDNNIAVRIKNSDKSSYKDLGRVDITQSTPTDQWIYFEKVFTVPYEKTGESQVFIAIKEYGSIRFSKFKLEVGNKATDWTPAPEDVDSAISTAQSTADTAQETIDNLQVGGRNLAENTNQGIKDWSWNRGAGDVSITEVVEDGIKTCKMTVDKDVTKWSVIQYNNIGRKKWKPDTVYCLSMDVKASVSTRFYPDFRTSGAKYTLIQSCTDIKDTTKANEWTKLSWIVKSVSSLPGDMTQNTYFRGMDGKAGVWYQFKNLKLEEGNKPTDWTPAPEDVDSAISTAEQNAKDYTDAQIEVKAEEITSTVSNTYATKTSLSEVKQTADGISVTLSTAQDDIKALQAQDPYNYSQLNDTTATGLGFTADSTADGHWYTLGTLARDTKLSDWITCTGGERLKITGQISSSVKGLPTKESTNSEYLAADIMITSKDAEGGNTINVYSNDVTSSESGTADSVSKVVTLDSTAKKFIIYLHLKGYPTFSGKIKIRNLKIEKVDDQALSEAKDDATTKADKAKTEAETYAKNRSDAAAKTATNYLGFDKTNGLIVGNNTSGTLSGANVQIKSDGINIRTGTTDTCSRATVTADGLKVYDTYGTTELASFGSTATIGKTASNHIILDSDGMTIDLGQDHPVATIGSTTTFGLQGPMRPTITTEGFYVYDSSKSSNTFQATSSGVIIGRESKGHAVIDDTYFTIYDGTTELASFGSDIKLGNGDVLTYIDNDGLCIHDTVNNVDVFNFTKDGITFWYNPESSGNPYKSYLSKDGIRVYAPTTVYPNFYIGNDSANVRIYYDSDVGCYTLSSGSGTLSMATVKSTSIFATGKITAKQLETSDYVVAAANMVFGDSEYTTERGIKTKFKDGNRHGVVTRVGTGGLTINFGWKGSSKYKTITQISGQTVSYPNSSGTTASSDKRLKTDFTELDNWDTFFDNLKPCAFKYKNGASGRYHIGFIAQEVEEALDTATLTNQDFGGIVKFPYRADEKDEEDAEFYEENGIKDGDDEYGLIYTEFTALNTHEIQKLKKENKELKLRVSDLEGRVSALESLMNMVSAYILDQNGNNDIVYG